MIGEARFAQRQLTRENEDMIGLTVWLTPRGLAMHSARGKVPEEELCGKTFGMFYDAQ